MGRGSSHPSRVAPCLFLALIAAVTLVHSTSALQRFRHSVNGDGNIRVLVVGDWGRRGLFNQSQVAQQMGIIGKYLDVNFVVSTGDNFYENGLKCEDDIAFEESFTSIYTARSLRTQWYAVLGNHDYRGDVIAQLSPRLRRKDKRWLCSRSFVVSAGPAELFFVDTTPFVDVYFTDPGDHVYDWRDVIPRKKYVSDLLQDIDLALTESTASWKIMIGHHPIRSAGHHGDTQELVALLLPILKKRNVDFYINGHDHCLQLIRETGSHIQFLTSGGGSKAWRGGVEYGKRGLEFYYDGQGFLSLELNVTDASLRYYDVLGKILHQWSATHITKALRFEPLVSVFFSDIWIAD